MLLLKKPARILPFLWLQSSTKFPTKVFPFDKAVIQLSRDLISHFHFEWGKEYRLNLFMFCKLALVQRKILALLQSIPSFYKWGNWGTVRWNELRGVIVDFFRFWLAEIFAHSCHDLHSNIGRKEMHKWPFFVPSTPSGVFCIYSAFSLFWVIFWEKPLIAYLR